MMRFHLPVRAKVLSVVLAGLLFLPCTATGRQVWEKDWIEVRTPNFVIMSVLDRDKTLEFTRDLENFRSVVGSVTNIPAVRETVPTHIFLFDSRVPDIGLSGNLAGYFVGKMRGNFMPMYFRSYREALEILQHEYTHFLTYNHSTHEYPSWFGEGIAELLSTVVVEGDVAVFGKPPRNLVEWLGRGGWLSYQYVIDEGRLENHTGRRIALFYAQSWLLAHYLMIGRNKPGTDRELRLYVELVTSGLSPAEAFESAFGMPLATLTRTVASYLNKGLPYYEIKLARAVPDSELHVRELAADEVAARIGFFCLLISRWECAEKYFAGALAGNADNAEALIGTGDLHKIEGRFDEAQSLYERALALEPDDAMHELDFGEYFHTRAVKEQDPARRTHWIELARKHMQRSLELQPENPEALAMLGDTYVLEGNSVHTGVDKLLLAGSKLPANIDIKMSLAEAYVAAGTPALAVPIARRVYRMAHGGWRDYAAELLKKIDPSFTPPEAGD